MPHPIHPSNPRSLQNLQSPNYFSLSLVAVFFAKISLYPTTADRLKKKGVQKGKGQSVNTEPLFP